MLKILTGEAFPSMTQRILARARREKFKSLTKGPTRQHFINKRSGTLPLIYDLTA